MAGTSVPPLVVIHVDMDFSFDAHLPSANNTPGLIECKQYVPLYLSRWKMSVQHAIEERKAGISHIST